MTKRILSIMLATAMLTITATGCKKKEQVADGTIRIGISKIVSHPALDAVEQGVIDVLAENNRSVVYDLQNANGDINTAASIANKFKSEKADINIGIATPTAVALANAIDDKPVIFSVITDPVSANLVETMDSGYKNITGVSDATPIESHIKLFQQIKPFKKLGFIYTSSESNGIALAEQTKAVCDELGIEFIPATISNASEIKQAAESLIGRVDAFYVTPDNTLVSGINALTATAVPNGVPVFSADVSSAKDGGVVLALGFDYYNLGRATGEMVIEILDGKNPADMPVVLLDDPSVLETLVDYDTLKKLNLTIPDGLLGDITFTIENGSLIDHK